MKDVFISYASEDRERVRKLASALGARGWSVWWDREIIAGQTFDQVIEDELDTAKSVVVLWSKHSISSEWVMNEATVGSERGVLVPALIDKVKVPLEFRRKQAADLTGWDGDPSHGGFRALCEGITAKANISSVPPHQSTTPLGLGFRRNCRTLGAIAGAFCLMLAILYAWMRAGHSSVESGALGPFEGGAVVDGVPFTLHLPGPRSFRLHVSFKSKFSGSPKVVVSLDHLSTGAPTRIRTFVQDVSMNGFSVLFETEENAIVKQLEASWVAIGPRQP
jgi:hypothetical protein